jgi:hypothetical protein
MPVEEIEGYAQFLRDTQRIEREIPEQMRNASIEVANTWVSLAQANANTDYANEASQEFSVSSDGEGASISNSSPVFYGSEFGGRARPETMQFPPYNGREGYWFYPARRDNEDTIMAIWDKGMENAMRDWDRHG